MLQGDALTYSSRTICEKCDETEMEPYERKHPEDVRVLKKDEEEGEEPRLVDSA
jgi:hypothetical protein